MLSRSGPKPAKFSTTITWFTFDIPLASNKEDNAQAYARLLFRILPVSVQIELLPTQIDSPGGAAN